MLQNILFRFFAFREVRALEAFSDFLVSGFPELAQDDCELYLLLPGEKVVQLAEGSNEVDFVFEISFLVEVQKFLAQFVLLEHVHGEML